MKKIFLILIMVICLGFPNSVDLGSNPIRYFVNLHSANNNVDPELVMAMIKAESNHNQNVKSTKGAIGVMQLMPSTARMLGVNPHNMEDNIKGGILYISRQLKEFKSVKLALAAYNAGPGNIYKYDMNVPPFRETRRYVSSICSEYACG